MKTTDKYIVINENTLGYRIEGGSENSFGILHGSVLRGSPHGPLDGWSTLGPLDTVRPATLKDFEDYRVSAKGHLI